MIKLSNITKVFQQGNRTIQALNNVSLHVPAGQIYGVIGASGAGKSTLIRCVNLLERPTQGSVEVGGQELTALSEKELTKARRQIGMIFQHFNLLASRTVFGNVALPLELDNTPKEEVKRRVTELLDRIVADVPAPTGDPKAPARALIFDSVYDSYRGIVTYIRMEDGELHDREKVHMMGIGMTHDPIEIGVISPDMTRTKALGAGEVGYIITGAKDVSQSKVGDTITSAINPATEPLEGYRDPQPMVYAGLFPIDNAQYPELREALDKLKLNDAALIYEPETTVALGFGFRCGFLGLLHMEIVTERLSREFDLDLISTAPNVPYEVTAEDNSVHRVTNPSEFPEGKIKKIVEPMVAADIITPKDFIGAVMDLCQDHRGQMGTMEYISADRVEMHYRIPLAEIVFDFFI